MGAVAGANEAEQKLQGAEQTPPKPERAAEQVSQPATEQAPDQTPQAPGFGERGRMRRRARFLRKARELAYRDLGGLVFDLHRFGQRNDQLVLAKLATLGQIDTELRELEEVLRDRRPVTVLREVGIAACPRCAAIHGSDDRFCPGCGLAFDARPTDRSPPPQWAREEQPRHRGASRAPATTPPRAAPLATSPPAAPASGAPRALRRPRHRLRSPPRPPEPSVGRGLRLCRLPTPRRPEPAPAQASSPAKPTFPSTARKEPPKQRGA